MKAKKFIAAGMSIAWPVSSALAQQAAGIEPVRPQTSVLFRPYLPAQVPPVRLSNSGRVSDLIREGTLYLTAQDAIALALENNIDLEISRYDRPHAEWALERSRAGGSLPGVPSGASQVSSVANGQGVAGSQAAAGVGTNFGGNNGNSGNATITQVGPVTQVLDPSVQEASTFSHQSAPQQNTVQSGVSNLITNTRVYSGSYQQGFLTGGNLTVSYTDHYLNENAPSDYLNPSVAPALSVAFQQNLLRGFGSAAGGRTIEVAKINVSTTDLNFKTQVISLAVNVLNAYYALSADLEDLQSKQSALATAQTSLSESQKRLTIGTLAELDVTSAESLAAASQQDLLISETTLRQDEIKLKNLISRRGIADAVVGPVNIITLDRLTIPAEDNIPSWPELVAKAQANRADLAVEQNRIKSAQVSNLGTKNGLLPTSQVFATQSQAGLAGTPKAFGANPYFIGGTGTALGQVFRRNFPTERVGEFVSANVYNRQAQADYGIDQLQLRQTQLTTQKDLNQIQVDVLNSIVALKQARVRYEAGVQNRILQQKLLDAEQRRFALGASTPYNVAQQQRDLVGAQSTELGALVSYTNARIALDQTTGTILEANNISIGEARADKVERGSTLPAEIPGRK